MKQLSIILVLIFAIVLPACTATPTPQVPLSTPAPVETLDASTISPTNTPPETSSQIELTLWVAPVFSPQAESPAAELFSQRLAAFEEAHEGVNIIVRVKPATGSGSLIETLESALAAAPGAVPDLISLNPAGLYSAALKGWIVELDPISEDLADPTWYEHAASAAQIDGQLFGIPISSQADVLILNNQSYLQPPQDWDDVLAANATYLFPAGDREAGLTLSYYLRMGGELYNEEGRPALDGALVASVLEFYATAQASNVLPPRSAEMVSTSEIWQDWFDAPAGSAVVPLSLLLGNFNPESMTASLIPAQSAPGFSLTKTWTWSIVTTDSVRQSLVLELIDWLRQPEFVGPWSQALNLVPPDSSSLQLWSAGSQRNLVQQIALAAEPYPGPEELATFGPALYSAVQAVIASDLPPATAVEEALQLLSP